MKIAFFFSKEDRRQIAHLGRKSNDGLKICRTAHAPFVFFLLLLFCRRLVWLELVPGMMSSAAKTITSSWFFGRRANLVLLCAECGMCSGIKFNCMGESLKKHILKPLLKFIQYFLIFHANENMKKKNCWHIGLT